jgi:AcrR family transcriptional regulator
MGLQLSVKVLILAVWVVVKIAKKINKVISFINERFKDMSEKTAKTKYFIENAVIELMEDKTFEKLTINDICKTAEISRNTFYNYYHDKYSFVDELVDYVEKICEDFCFLEEGHKSWHFLLNELLKKYRLLHSFLQNEREPEFSKIFKALIVESIYFLLYHKSPSTNLYLTIGLSEGVYGIIAYWLGMENHEMVNKLALVEESIETLLDGTPIND